MDILGYTYDAGNKLVKVTDTGNVTYGFKDGANLTTEYIYDVNGNMKTDANKNMTDVQYNSNAGYHKWAKYFIHLRCHRR